jgi:hypothetical protein
MKIGVIFTAFNCKNYVKDSLNPWIEARRTKLSNHEFVISAVSVPFEEYQGVLDEDDGTTKILQEYLEKKSIDFLVDKPRFVKEHVARDNALQLLLKEGIDCLILVDGDEFYTLDEIGKIFNYVMFNGFVQWFSVSLKNYVFDDKTYLAEPFTPPRIFMNGRNSQQIKLLFWDNDIAYGYGNNNVSYQNFINLVIPKDVAWVKHLTWLNDDISKKKVEYQKKHFKNICSFKWDEQKGLMFDEEFFKTTGQPIPRIVKENSTLKLN